MTKRSVTGAVEAKPEVEIWRRPDFWNRRPRLPIPPPIHQSVYLAPLQSFSELRSKVGQSTQLLPICPRRFRITVHLTTFQTYSGIFESISGCLILHPVHKFRFIAPSVLIGNMFSRLCAIRQPYGPKYGKK